ncbi:type II toxin-antitoxin system RelE/ParE family toxin [Pseudomonas sp. C27(2019)]|uniref:type II toxin-antitoxin system RelE/ParE family toxin n=1 Tax=Pseudomonas sp. C27(2019) TaxID=2604941 RepID=UPI001247EF8B|nr:type II toxin-antitoxin system RelE/ParE family toxin [Pseudomonas sp. C27(2019)]QEY57753.1 type II toxin-antitoxin system RelE/ParE family toxin [Pseudomonas sp. C27(2019)]
MLNGYSFTSDAKTDLVEIRRFTLKNWGVPQSEKYLLELRKTLRLLVEFPAQGRLRPEVSEGVLSFPYASHVIYYVVHQQQLVVFAVLHKRMAPRNHLPGRELG